MDPVALWEEIVQAAEDLVEKMGLEGERFVEESTNLELAAYDIATRIQDLNEWIQKGGFSPFEKSESYSSDSWTDEDSPNAQYERTNKNEDYV